MIIGEESEILEFKLCPVVSLVILFVLSSSKYFVQPVVIHRNNNNIINTFFFFIISPLIVFQDYLIYFEKNFLNFLSLSL